MGRIGKQSHMHGQGRPWQTIPLPLPMHTRTGKTLKITIFTKPLNYGMTENKEKEKGNKTSEQKTFCPKEFTILGLTNS